MKLPFLFHILQTCFCLVYSRYVQMYRQSAPDVQINAWVKLKKCQEYVWVIFHPKQIMFIFYFFVNNQACFLIIIMQNFIFCNVKQDSYLNFKVFMCNGSICCTNLKKVMRIIENNELLKNSLMHYSKKNLGEYV